MRILDEQNNEIEMTEERESLGRLVNETIRTKFHEAVQAVEEIGHYETIAEYPNGGKDVEWVVETPAVAAADEYWDTEDILRFVPFTAEELAQRQIAALKRKLTESDPVFTETFEGLLNALDGATAVTFATRFLAWCSDTLTELRDTLDERKSIRKELSELQQTNT